MSWLLSGLSRGYAFVAVTFACALAFAAIQGKQVTVGAFEAQSPVSVAQTAPLAEPVSGPSVTLRLDEPPPLRFDTREAVIVPQDQTPIDVAALTPEMLAALDANRDEDAEQRVIQRLLIQVPADLVPYFDLYLYVSKSMSGPFAQHLYVVQRTGEYEFNVLYNWPVSTGREQMERTPRGVLMSTETPTGFFRLDRDRFHKRYRSRQWDAKMPYTMFFDYQERWTPSGLAIHGADGAQLAELGARASAGCIRLHPDHAKILFNLIRKQYAGQVPAFAFDRRGNMSREGVVLRDRRGRAKLERGYRVLVFIEDYTGEEVIAALY